MPDAGVIAPQRAAIAFILGTVVLDVLAFGLIVPVLPLLIQSCLLYTSPSPRDRQKSRMPSSA